MLHLQQFLYITRVFGWFLSYMNKKQEQTEEHEGTIYSQSLCYTCISLKFFIFNTHDDIILQGISNYSSFNTLTSISGRLQVYKILKKSILKTPHPLFT